MRNWFRPRSAGIDTTVPTDVYEDGRLDERRRIEAETPAAVDRAAIDAASEHGRERERARLARRRSPFFSLMALVAVLVAGALIYLAVRNGSFSGGGAVVDQKLDQAAHTINAPLKSAAETTGDALKKAGQDLK